jgi:hypothetical protein
MSVKDPQTVPEWKAYIRQLPRDQVHRKAMAANSINFVEELQKDGLDGADIDEVLFTFAKRLFDENKYIPGSGGTQYLNYRTLLEDHGVDPSDNRPGRD